MGSVKQTTIREFKRILIANRGEISCRIQRTCHRLGIETIAVGSEADRDAAHMQMADYAVVIGASEASASYLNGQVIIDAALQNKASAIHPGYGFLSENPDFALAVQKAGLVFIGPSHEAIRVMGSKSEAKGLAQSLNIPIIPGYVGDDDLRVEAQNIGFPLFIKAIYGGGGKGMRRVNEAREFEGALASCQREAKSAFDNDKVMLEKYLVHPRHVEVQILGDSHGNCIALSDRDCSLQRRHQKIIEEAPAPDLSDTLRSQLHQAAVAIAKAVRYEGLGTVEFLITKEEDFYFLEMNTRLQVEHPVTEMILGLDLVEWQIRVAGGETLTLKSDLISPQGHAFEARLYAEDADHEFLPSTGKINQLVFPVDEHVRIDTGVREGDTVTIYYDPMVAKVIAWGEQREEALKRLGNALSRTQLKGLKTNLNFLRDLLSHPHVQRSAPDIGFIDRILEQRTNGTKIPAEVYLMAALWLHHESLKDFERSPWVQHDGWRLNCPAVQYYCFADGVMVSVSGDESGVKFQLENKIYEVHQISIGHESDVQATIDGTPIQVKIEAHEDILHIFQGETMYHLRHTKMNLEGPSKSSGPVHLTAPMPGRVVSVMVSVNEPVQAGQPLMILEAMKMEHTIRAPHEGVVDYLPFSPGDFCEEGVELVRLR